MLFDLLFLLAKSLQDIHLRSSGSIETLDGLIGKVVERLQTPFRAAE
jgi:hypothetical protein